jgi:uncharacterized membrane protein YadS
VLLAVTVTGSLFSSAEEIAKDPTKGLELMSTRVPSFSTFFVNYILLWSFVSLRTSSDNFIFLQSSACYSCTMSNPFPSRFEIYHMTPPRISSGAPAPSSSNFSR